MPFTPLESLLWDLELPAMPEPTWDDSLQATGLLTNNISTVPPEHQQQANKQYHSAPDQDFDFDTFLELLGPDESDPWPSGQQDWWESFDLPDGSMYDPEQQQEPTPGLTYMSPTSTMTGSHGSPQLATEAYDASSAPFAAGPAAPSGGPRPHHCATCPKAFRTGSELRKHMKTHLQPHERPFQCPTCSRRWSSRRDLRRHYESKHAHDKPVVPCPMCGVLFAAGRRDNLKRHIKKQHGEAEG